MKPLDLHAKKIMEECKERARSAGMKFDDNTLEYYVTNRDMVELSPKVFIPTHYDYWVHDLEVFKGKKMYDLFPNNPYETVINTRPAISFYNDNNPDWLNVMIFYHVLGHIDFFQNNAFFKNTWTDDFLGKAAADKKLIAKLRHEKGRWLDYVVEFSRGIDNLADYYDVLFGMDSPKELKPAKKVDFYFGKYLQDIRKATSLEFGRELDRYNEIQKQFHQNGDDVFFLEISKENPEFEALFRKAMRRKNPGKLDLLQYIDRYSEFVNKPENQWMKAVMNVVRDTSLYFAPQIRTKIMNEGWASYWHEKLFIADDRIRTHEVGFAKVNSGVLAMPRVGLNPYALGKALFEHLQVLADKGKLTYDYDRIQDIDDRKNYDKHTGLGSDYMFYVRENMCDSMFVDAFTDQDFIDRNGLFVAGKRINPQKKVYEYYVKSRKASDYRDMVVSHLYHPPSVIVDESKMDGNDSLYIVHKFEGKPLLNDFIPNTLLGIEYLWGGPVHLETHDVDEGMLARLKDISEKNGFQMEQYETPFEKVLYSMKGGVLSRKVLKD